MAKKITWWQAAEIIGITDRQMRRWHWRYREDGYYGLLDRQVGKPRPQRVPLAVVEQVFALHRDKYFDFNVRHFHEKLEQEHEIRLSYKWVKKALQGAAWCVHSASGGMHRRRRERRPLPGMMLHIDGSRHQWFQDDRWYDLLVILDDATNQIYYAQLVEEESTMTVLLALREVVEQQGIFCALYSDRASHSFWTPRAGGKSELHPSLRKVAMKRFLRDVLHVNGGPLIPNGSEEAQRSFDLTWGKLHRFLSQHQR